VRYTGFCGSAVEVEGRRRAFDWPICADGQNSWLRRNSGLFPAAGARMRYGFRRHYQIAPWKDFVEVHWAEGGQMYVTPIAHDEVCVAFVTHDLRLRFDAALPQFANLAQRLAEVDIVGQTRGAVTPSRRLRGGYRAAVLHWWAKPPDRLMRLRAKDYPSPFGKPSRSLPPYVPTALTSIKPRTSTSCVLLVTWHSCCSRLIAAGSYGGVFCGRWSARTMCSNACWPSTLDHVRCVNSDWAGQWRLGWNLIHA
jgi:hypothetical protein